MIIGDCMKRNVVSISGAATLGQAAGRLVQRRIGTLPVVEADGRLVGVVQMKDLLGLIMPDFVKFIEDFDFVHNFGVLESQRPAREDLARPVREVMQPPLSVDESCGLVRAFALMLKHDLHDLPVVGEADRLAGIASRVDIGVALLAGWRVPELGGAA